MPVVVFGSMLRAPHELGDQMQLKKKHEMMLLRPSPDLLDFHDPTHTGTSGWFHGRRMSCYSAKQTPKGVRGLRMAKYLRNITSETVFSEHHYSSEY